MLTARAEIRVRYAETDAMGIVHHANYFSWFEVARITLLDQLGLPYRQLEAEGNRLPLLGAEIRYLRPARFDDRLTVHLEIREKPGVRMTCHYRITRGEGDACEELTTGATHHCWVDLDSRPCRPHPRFHDAWERAHQATGG